jgi:hypothetical protein
MEPMHRGDSIIDKSDGRRPEVFVAAYQFDSRGGARGEGRVVSALIASVNEAEGA